MKKVFFAALLFIGVCSFAQDGHHMDGKHDQVQLTPEQRNSLHLKQMTLDLGLNDSQQKDMAKVIADQESARAAAISEMKANKEKNLKPTADEMYARKSKMLDAQITNKERIKKILTPEQFQKWEKAEDQRKEKFKKGMHDRRGKMHEPRE
jgi:Spy/CpxP family protein refolding chaperone